MRGGGSPLPAAAIVCVQVTAGITTICRSDIQGIVPADVAESARHGRMAIRQGEAR